jgi:PAS domain-containing protein
VIISDSAHRVTHLNAPAELLTGWSQTEARGHALDEILGETACQTQVAGHHSLKISQKLARQHRQIRPKKNHASRC